MFPFKKKPKYKLLLKIALSVFLVIFISTGYIFFSRPKTASASWWNDAWMYRRSVTVTNNTSAQTNVYISTSVDTSASGSFQSDCGDLRFVTESGEVLDYYKYSGSCGSTLTIHVQYTTFPAGAQTLYIYYGNPSAPNGFSSSDFKTAASSYSVGTIGSQETGGGPIGYWSFDDPSAGTEDTGGVHDESGQGYNGTNTNAVQKTESECQIGKCMYFDGVYGTEINVDTKDNMGEFTACAWFKANSLVDFNIFYKIWEIQYSSGRLLFWVQTDGSFPAAYSSIDIEANKWYHVCGVYYGVGTAPKLFLDGVDRSDSTVSGSGSQSDDSSEALQIGYLFPGFIDDAKIYPYARTAGQIQQEYNAGLAGVKTSHGTAASFGDISDSWLTDGLVGYWKMDESATSTAGAIDSSGNGNDGTYVDNASTTAGKFGRGGVFDVSNDSISFGDTGSTTTFTFSAWVRPDTTTGTGDYDTYGFTIAASAASGYGYPFWLTLHNNEVRFWAFDNSAPSGFRETSGSVITNGIWQLVTVSAVWGGESKVYVNGEEVLSFTNDAESSWTSVFMIGDLRSGRNISFDGIIDDARLYNRILSPGEVKKLYAWAPGPIGHWKLDEKSGATAYDSGSGGNNGTLTSSPAWTRGKYGSALQFSSSNYVNITDADNLDVLGDITVSFWMKPSNGSSENEPVSKYNYTNGWGFDMNDSEGSYCTTGIYFFGRSGSGPTWSDSGCVSYTLGQWQHVTGVRSGSIWAIYINGVLESYQSGDSGTLVGSTNINIGRSPQGGGDLYFSGPVDDVRIYDYARTQKQILEDMAGGYAAIQDLAFLHLNFEEGYGATAHDSTIYQNNGTLYPVAGGANTTAAAMWTNEGKFGKAIEFDGTDDYLVTSSVDLSGTQKISVSLWYNYQVTTDSTGSVILEISDDAYSSAGGFIFADAANDGICTNALELFINGNVSYNTACYQRPSTGWHHFVAIADKSLADEVDLYIDGLLQSPLSRPDDNNNTNTFLDVPVYLMRHGDTAGYYGKGVLDEVKIYPFVLTAEDINKDYNQGKAIVMGSTGKPNSAATSSFAASLEYCVPGSTDYCARPLAEWKFNEKSGSIIYDTSGNGNNGTVKKATWGRGKIGSALNFNGTSNVASTSLGNSIKGLSQATISTWVYVTRYNSTYGGEIYFEPISTGGSITRFELYLNTDGTLSLNGCTTDTNCVTSWVTTDNPIPLNQWIHVVGIFNSVSDVHSLYLNGKLAKSSSYSINTFPNTNPGDVPTIGNDMEGHLYNYYGFIDELRIYPYVRTPAQIAWEYNKGKPVGYWKFDECQGSTIHDESGNGSNGTLQLGTSGITATGTCAVSASSFWYNGRTGKYNSAGSFDGTDDYVNVGDTNMNINSISMWVKLDNTTNYIINLDGGTHTITVSAGVVSAAGFSAPTIYVNGAVSQNISTSWSHVAITTATAIDANSLTIGRVSSNYFDGMIDDFKMFNYPLTDEQIKMEYAGGAVNFR